MNSGLAAPTIMKRAAARMILGCILTRVDGWVLAFMVCDVGGGDDGDDDGDGDSNDNGLGFVSISCTGTTTAAIYLYTTPSLHSLETFLRQIPSSSTPLRAGNDTLPSRHTSQSHR